MNQVVPGGFSQAMQSADDPMGGIQPVDPRLECEDVPLYDDTQVMDKLMGIINQLGDLENIKLDVNSKTDKTEKNGKKADVELKEKVSGGTFMVTNHINKAIQQMIVDINEKGFIIHPNGRFKMIWDTVMAM